MNKKLNWRINKEIRANKIRLIGSDDKQIGVVSLTDALKKAKEEGLDLVEIVPKANPPVVKLIDFDKFRYREEKKLKEQKKKESKTELKEIRFSPFIAEGDFNTRIKRIEEFLSEGNKVRLAVVFRGREMGSKKFGYQVLEKITAKLTDKIAIDMEPKFLGRHLVMIISPLKNK